MLWAAGVDDLMVHIMVSLHSFMTTASVLLLLRSNPNLIGSS